MGAKKDVEDFLYNEDRSIASLAGAPPQETISSEIGRNEHKNIFARFGAWALDKIQKNHVENAIAHANKLDAVDDGEEK